MCVLLGPFFLHLLFYLWLSSASMRLRSPLNRPHREEHLPSLGWIHHSARPRTTVVAIEYIYVHLQKMCLAFLSLVYGVVEGLRGGSVFCRRCFSTRRTTCDSRQSPWLCRLSCPYTHTPILSLHTHTHTHTHTLSFRSE